MDPNRKRDSYLPHIPLQELFINFLQTKVNAGKILHV